MIMEYGYIKVSVRTAGGALPVDGANVRVYGKTDSELLFTVFTDNSGNTDKLRLEAPPKSLSETSGNENVYAVYNITVTKDGYRSVEDFGVPVFSGVTSIQTVDMIPLPDGTRYEDYYSVLNYSGEYGL